MAYGKKDKANKSLTFLGFDGISMKIIREFDVNCMQALIEAELLRPAS